ncbi:MAG: cysteine desulfurase [Nitrososphaeria archaeon]
MSLDTIRGDFPLFSQGYIYLDSASTALIPKPIAEKSLDYYLYYKANPLRSVHTLAQKIEEKIAWARSVCAKFINALPEEIIFVKNTTEGLNLIAKGLRIGKGGNIVVTALEHHSNFVPWLVRCKRDHREFRIIFPKGEDGILSPEDFSEKIDETTKIVAISHITNVLGTILPIKEITKIAHKNGAYVVLDAAQSAPHISLDVKELNVDFLALSGHKICGPSGCGLLYIRKELAEKIEPLNYGGGACRSVEISKFKYMDPPYMFEAGTIPFCEILMMADAIEYIKKIGLKNILDHEKKLLKVIHELLDNLNSLKIYGPSPEFKTSIFSFNLKGVNPMNLGMMLDSISKIEVRSGHMCAEICTKKVLKEKDGVVRASTYFYNNEEDVQKFAEALKKISSAFSRT